MKKLRDLVPTLLRASAPESGATLNFTAPVELTAAAEGESGAAKRPTFAINAYSGGPIQTSFSFYPVVLELSGLKAARKRLPVLTNHDPGRPVGQADSITIDAKGVRLTGSITGDDDDAMRIVAHAKNGFEWQASIGASVQRREFVEAGKTAQVNGRTVTGPMIIAREATLIETSFVAIGADETSSAKVAAHSVKAHSGGSGGGGISMNFNEWLKAKGIDNFEALAKPIQDQLKAAHAAEVKAAADDGNPDGDADGGAGDGKKPAKKAAQLTASRPSGGGGDVQQLVTDAVQTALQAAQKTWQEEQELRAQITRITARHPELQAKAIAEKWSIEKAELEVMRASRPAIGAAFVNTGAGQADIAPDQVLQAALCLAGNLEGVEEQFDDKTLQAAHTRYRGRIGLQQILLEAAWAGGYSGAHFDRSQGGMQEILKAAFSTFSLPGILSNTANKFLLQGFTAVEDTWRIIAAIRSTNDFKQVTSYRLTGNMEFEEIGPDGELKHGEVGEESFTNRVRTHGIMLAITRVDIRNDDLNALSAVPRRIGRGGALKFNKVFWTRFMDNAAFFAVANKNYFEGATSVLGINSLTEGEKLFFDQVDPDGDPLGIMPNILLVPNALNTPASQLTRDTEIRDTTASTKYTTGNPHAGKFTPARSSYLSNAGIAGNSVTAWYLLADPADLATIEAAFLDGVQQPTVETADADFNTLGIQMRGYFDFGVELQEHRAGVKSKGAA